MRFEIGSGVECDLDVLLRSRMLIQAMSGAGKSWLIRRILEQTFDEVQHFVLDSEGDFKTLRERFPYLLVAADGGDIDAAVEWAGELAEKLLQLQVSAILDISSLPSGEDGGERALFVARFLRGLLDAPSRLWHDALVVLDEAQLFAPQSYQVVSRQAVNDAAGLVRKRGLGLIVATNRLSELHKTTSAHLANKLIGRSMGIDGDRAARELGLRRQDARDLQSLADGEFYAFGAAIGKEIVKLHVGPVKTTHPSPGGDRTAPPPPTPEQIKAVIAELAELRRDEPAPSEAKGGKGRLPGVREVRPDLVRRVEELEQANGKLREEVARVRGVQATTQADFVRANELNAKASRAREALLAFLGVDGTAPSAGAEADIDAVTERVLARMPAGGSRIEVPAPESLRKKHLEQAAERIYGRVAPIDDEGRKALELLLGQDQFFTLNRVALALSGSDSGGTRDRWAKTLKGLVNVNLVARGGSGRTSYKANIRGCVESELAPHGAKADEVAAVEAQVLHRLATTR